MRLALQALLLPPAAALVAFAWFATRTSAFRVALEAGARTDGIGTTVAVGTLAGVLVAAVVGALGGAEVALALGAAAVAGGAAALAAVGAAGEPGTGMFLPALGLGAVGWGIVRPTFAAAAVRAVPLDRMHAAALLALAVTLGVSLAASAAPLVGGVLPGLVAVLGGAGAAAALAAALAGVLAAAQLSGGEETPHREFDPATVPFSLAVLAAYALAQIGEALGAQAEGDLFYGNPDVPELGFVAASDGGLVLGCVALGLALAGSLAAGVEWPRGVVGGLALSCAGLLHLATLALWWGTGGALPVAAILGLMFAGGALEAGKTLVTVAMLRGVHWRATTALAGLPVLVVHGFRLVLWGLDVQDPRSGLGGGAIVLVGAGAFTAVASWLAWRSRRAALADAEAAAAA